MLFKGAEVATILTQIYYEESQKAHLYSFAVPYLNNDLTIFFENSIIQKIVNESNAERLSICSWKLRSKLRWYIGRPREITQELLESDYEVMSFTKNTEGHEMFGAAERWHPGFMKTFDMILGEIGKKRPLKVRDPIYQNHFSAKREIYQDYVKNYLSPAMRVMTSNPEINTLIMKDSRYSTLDRKDWSHMKQILGVPFIPMAPFLLERLFSVYVQNSGIKVSYL